MCKNNQQGFSLIELLIVVVIIGIIATIGVPLYSKAKLAAENTSAKQTTRVMAQSQISYYTRNSRYARLTELNAENGDRFGLTVGDDIRRGSFLFSMTDEFASDDDLKTGYELLATRTVASSELPYVLKLNSTGQITQITP